MKIYQLRRSQRLPISIDAAWQYFSSPENLKEITPEDMNFVILKSADKEIFSGMIIEYTVSPLFHIPLKWITKITEVKKPFYFIDEQMKGPYHLWRHTHQFRAIAGGVEIKDTVDYGLPCGSLGRLGHFLFVQRKLEHIFLFREKTLRSKFGSI